MNSRHSRLKDFLRPRRGIATRYLDNYLTFSSLPRRRRAFPPFT